MIQNNASVWTGLQFLYHLDLENCIGTRVKFELRFVFICLIFSLGWGGGRLGWRPMYFIKFANFMVVCMLCSVIGLLVRAGRRFRALLLLAALSHPLSSL